MAEKTLSIPVKPGVPEWDESDSAALREFLVGTTGQRLLAVLHFSRPKVTGFVVERRAILSDERAGYESCMEDLLAFADPGRVTERDREAHRVTTDAALNPTS